jgi:fused signal recognition particle receptor
MSVLDRLKAGLARTREALNTPVEDLVRGRRPLEPADLDAMEEALLAADLGLPAVSEAMETLRARSGKIAGGGVEAMRALLRDEIVRSLDRPAGPAPFSARPLGGVPGGGERSRKDHDRGQAGPGVDRARQAQPALRRRHLPRGRRGPARGLGGTLGQRLSSRAPGADPSSVVTDALRAARARGTDAVLVDTAGRLHTKGNLMAELAKMARVAARRWRARPTKPPRAGRHRGSNGLHQAASSRRRPR